MLHKVSSSALCCSLLFTLKFQHYFHTLWRLSRWCLCSGSSRRIWVQQWQWLIGASTKTPESNAENACDEQHSRQCSKAKYEQLLIVHWPYIFVLMMNIIGAFYSRNIIIICYGWGRWRNLDGFCCWHRRHRCWCRWISHIFTRTFATIAASRCVLLVAKLTNELTFFVFWTERRPAWITSGTAFTWWNVAEIHRTVERAAELREISNFSIVA